MHKPTDESTVFLCFVFFIILHVRGIFFFSIKLDDVEEGGATVFTQAGVAVKPKKGMSVFWWNLMSDLSGDTSTRHGGCPVLHGSKWSKELNNSMSS